MVSDGPRFMINRIEGKLDKFEAKSGPAEKISINSLPPKLKIRNPGQLAAYAVQEKSTSLDTVTGRGEGEGWSNDNTLKTRFFSSIFYIQKSSQ
jgi:hypothetical protein